jgi:molecular chaperone GrpE
MSRRTADPQGEKGVDLREEGEEPATAEPTADLVPREEEEAPEPTRAAPEPDEAPGEASGLDVAPEAAPASEQLEALERECAQLRENLLRRRAEFENYRKRVERDRHTAAREALASVFRELVGTLDNLERALAAEGAPDRLREGVELTYRELVGLLEAHRVLPVDPRGEPFDPEVHQALVHEPVPGLAEGTVAEVFRKGYTFGDHLLRPALVKVAKGEPEPGGAGDEEGR